MTELAADPTITGPAVPDGATDNLRAQPVERGFITTAAVEKAFHHNGIPASEQPQLVARRRHTTVAVTWPAPQATR